MTSGGKSQHTAPATMPAIMRPVNARASTTTPSAVASSAAIGTTAPTSRAIGVLIVVAVVMAESTPASSQKSAIESGG